LIDRDKTKGLQMEKELNDSHCKVVFKLADLASADDCASAVAALDDDFDRVDGLVNCVGVTTRGTLEDTTVEKWDAVLNINLRSAFLLTQSVTSFMKRRRTPGSVVNISSVHGHGGGHDMLPYAVSKAGMIAMTKNNAAELLEFGIRVNVVNVGWTVTETEDAFQKRTNGPEWEKEAEKVYPTGRLLQSEDIASTVGFLLSDASVMITGSVVDQHPEMILGCLPRRVGNH